MRHIYLLRHAKSSWDDPTLADHDRPLAPRGRKAAKRMARHLEDEGIRPQLVLCSSSARTRETLERIRQALGPAEISIENDLYAADATALLHRLRRLSEARESVLLIGHNPGLQDLALELAATGADVPRAREKLPTGALATLAYQGAWAELAPGSCSLVRLVFPRELA